MPLLNRIIILVFFFLMACPDPAGSEEIPGQVYDLLMAKGVHAMNQGRFEEAGTLFKDVLKTKPRDFAASYRLGVALRSLGRYRPALEMLNTAAALDPAYQGVHLDLGITLYHLEQWEDAQTELLAAEAAEPPLGSRHGLTQYYLGLTHQKQQRYQEAAGRFLRAAALSRELEPNARYYAGVAFYRMGRLEEARDELETVLRIGASSPETESSRELLQSLEEGGPKEKRLSLSLSLGGQMDSNVILLPDGSPLPSGISDKSDLRMVGTFGAGFGLFRFARWDGDAGYHFYQSLHRDLDAFNVQSHDADLTLTHHPSSRPYRIAFLYRFSGALVDQESYLRSHAAGLTFDHSSTPSRLGRLEYRYRNKDVLESESFPGNENRTGINHSVGFARYWILSEKKSNVHAGYTYDRDITRGDDWDYQGHSLNFGVTLPPFGLPAGREWFQPSLEAEVTLKKYDHPNSFSNKTPPDQREDVIQIYTLTLRREFTPWLSASAQYLYNVNDSNIDAFDYDRRVVSVFVTGRY